MDSDFDAGYGTFEQQKDRQPLVRAFSNSPSLPSRSLLESQKQLYELRDHLQKKIMTTKDSIRRNQKNKEELVSNYIKAKTCFSDGSSQANTVKAQFEKRNQALAQTIAKLTKKLEAYNQQLDQLQKYGKIPHSKKHSLSGSKTSEESSDKLSLASEKPQSHKNSLKSNISSSSNLQNVPMLVLPHRSGSADDISKLHENKSLDSQSKHQIPETRSVSGEPAKESSGHGEGTESSSDSPHNNYNFQTSSFIRNLSSNSGENDFDQDKSPISFYEETDKASQDFNKLDLLWAKLVEEKNHHLQLLASVDNLKIELGNQMHLLQSSLDTELERNNRLQERVYDLQELHNKESESLKLEIINLEERLVYQLDERLHEIDQHIGQFQTRVSKIENQQHQELQLLNMEELEGIGARAFVAKLVNVMLAVVAVLLVLLNTVSRCITPFFSSGLRTFTSLLCAFIAILVWYLLTYVVPL